MGLFTLWDLLTTSGYTCCTSAVGREEHMLCINIAIKVIEGKRAKRRAHTSGTEQWGWVCRHSRRDNLHCMQKERLRETACLPCPQFFVFMRQGTHKHSCPYHGRWQCWTFLLSEKPFCECRMSRWWGVWRAKVGNLEKGKIAESSRRVGVSHWQCFLR